MTEFLSPGVFVEERDAGPAVIQGVSTSNYGTVGWLRRGPVGQAVLITSFDAFIETFGTYWSNSYVPYAMAAFFQNGGARAYVVREVPTDAAKADCVIESAARAAFFIGRPIAGTLDLSGTQTDVNYKVDVGVAVDVGVVGAVPAATTLEEIVLALNTAFPGTASILTDPDGKRRIKLLSTTTGAASAIVIDDTTTPADDAQDLVFGTTLNGTTTKAGAAAVDRWGIEAENAGAWGNLVKLCIQGDDNYRNLTAGGYTKYQAVVYEESSLGAGDYAAKEAIGPFTFSSVDDDYIVDVVNGASSRVRVSENTGGTPWQLSPVTVVGEAIGIGDGAAVLFSAYLLNPEIVRSSLVITDGTETFTENGNGSLVGDLGGAGSVNYLNGLVSVTFNTAPAAADLVVAGYVQQSDESQACCTLTSGADGTVGLTRAQVSEPALQASLRGIYAMDKIEDLIQVSLPDFAGVVAVANDLIAWAENQKDRFIILDPSAGLSPSQVKDYRQYDGNFNSSYAALYYPWVTISDPITQRSMNVPPSGFIAGVIARTDQNRNVGKAPAGVNDGRLVGAIGVEYETAKGERDILYPVNINVLVDTPQTGRAVWGARTVSLNSEWKYIQIRRLFMFVEKSVFLNTHWAVFENNGPGLWAKVRFQLTAFLTNLFNEGYFSGATPADAFRIVCDSSNNPQSNIDAGLMTCDVYLKGNKPGEFIRFRFQQIVGQASA